MPKDIIDEIRHREYYAIHDYYYSGHLEDFIIEYKMFKNLERINLQEFYNDDKYFFENLKRIISSLKEVLKLDPDQLFKEIPLKPVKSAST